MRTFFGPKLEMPVMPAFIDKISALLLSLPEIVVGSNVVLLPDWPMHVNVFSLVTERSIMIREIARARDVGLLSAIEFVSISN